MLSQVGLHGSSEGLVFPNRSTLPASHFSPGTSNTSIKRREGVGELGVRDTLFGLQSARCKFRQQARLTGLVRTEADHRPHTPRF